MTEVEWWLIADTTPRSCGRFHELERAVLCAATIRALLGIEARVVRRFVTGPVTEVSPPR